LALETSFLIYDQVDPAKKDAAWGNMCVSRLRMDWRPLVNLEASRINKSYLFGVQDLSKVKKSFKDKVFLKNTDFTAIDVLYNIRNTLTEDILKGPPKAELKATDPTAMNDRQKDIQMLKSRGIIQGDISKYNKQVGLPPYKLPTDKFNGNVQQFDDMGLNDQDPDDLSFYQMNFQRLDYEIAGQQVINNIMKLNRFDEDLCKKFVIDYLANKVVCIHPVVNKITGAIDYNYVYPETAYGIFNDWNDGKNDICKGWQDSKTVPEFLQMAGNDFVWKRDWTKLLFSINYFNNRKFTGFQRAGVAYSVLGNESWMAEGGFNKQSEELLLDWTLAYTYKVGMGYIEWNTVEATSTALLNVEDPTKPPAVVGFVPFSFEIEGKKQIKSYQKESNYQQQWYKCYFLQTSSIGQWIFDFGKVYYQQLEGANDEYASGTLKYYINEGKSAVQVAIPFIDFVNFAYYKTLWIVHHAKPEEDQVVVEELLAISKSLQRMYPQESKGNVPTIDNILMQMIKFQRENFIRLRSYPQVDGRTVAQLPPVEGKRNGIDQLGQEMIGIFTWAENQIANKLGINSMRLGANPQSRESFKSEQATLESSLNTTGDIYRTIQFIKQRVATTTLLYAQDILRFKETIPYKWLKNLIGTEMFASLGVLDNVAAHRFGIFFGDYNTDVNKNNILQAANMALQEKQINIDGWAIITQTEDPKLGFKILSYLKLKADKKLRAQQMQDMQMQDQMANNQFQRQMQLEQTKVQSAQQIAIIQKQSAEEVAQITTQGKVDVKQLQLNAEPEKIAAQTEGAKEKEISKANVNQQQPFPVAAGG
jgi:hypothetical protein